MSARGRRALFTLIGCLLIGIALPAVASSASTEAPTVDSEACECQPLAGQWPDAGVLYRGRRAPQFDEILRWCAPGLWFSPDEPLLFEGRTIPSAHPCDTPSDRPVVYWQVEDVLLRGSRRVTEPVDGDSAFFEKCSSITLLFFFYYPKDVGMGGHVHDIEGVRMYVQLESLADSCRQVRLELVEAFAHGLPWYSNRLMPPPDTHYPVMLFVEEGKHASCPDRDARPTFTPGYDTNQFVNDAWGVRDVFGAGFLFTGNYQGWMTKLREPKQRLFPPVDGPPPCIPEPFSSLVNPDSSLGRYELRPGARLPQCPEMGTGRDSSFLYVMMTKNGLGGDVPLGQYTSNFGKKVARIKGAPQLLPAVDIKWDDGLGVVFSLMGINVHEGWLVPRVKVINGTALTLLWTRSAARWTDSYIAGGWEWKDATYATIEGNQVVTKEAINAPVWETGVKFRIGLPEGWIRWLFLNYRFAGVRGGIRFNGVDHLENARLSIEFGAGVW